MRKPNIKKKICVDENVEIIFMLLKYIIAS